MLSDLVSKNIRPTRGLQIPRRENDGVALSVEVRNLPLPFIRHDLFANHEWHIMSSKSPASFLNTTSSFMARLLPCTRSRLSWPICCLFLAPSFSSWGPCFFYVFSDAVPRSTPETGCSIFGCFLPSCRRDSRRSVSRSRGSLPRAAPSSISWLSRGPQILDRWDGLRIQIEPAGVSWCMQRMNFIRWVSS
ncbi:hypothetical protein F4821DRAFT_127057 [Hypoxylon rubiginosum]|uniref:Uncharacterized protein n=1 Tax=Hypoxylon rubiginosum TaxID=110542 RepID=A0ACC0CIA8_9PEZI|nr:hypothetical protein F4821DRAFT_127057 [Hypoxylon rubiginosum]